MIQTFIGKNTFALHTALADYLRVTREQIGDFGVERFDASDTDVDTLLQAVQSLPFLTDKKVVVIHSIQSNSALTDRISELIDRCADGVDVLLVEPNLDKRKSVYKQLQKQTKLTEFREPDVRTLPAWVSSYAESRGAAIGTSDANYLVELVGANQQLLAREIEKLALYNNKIDRSTIEMLVTPTMQNSVFSLLDAAFASNKDRAISLYREQRQARVEPLYIVAMLGWQLQSLALAVYATPQTEATLVAAGQSPFAARKALQLAKSTSKQTMKRISRALSELDQSIKTIADPDAAVELFLLEM